MISGLKRVFDSFLSDKGSKKLYISPLELEIDLCSDSDSDLNSILNSNSNSSSSSNLSSNQKNKNKKQRTYSKPENPKPENPKPEHLDPFEKHDKHQIIFVRDMKEGMKQDMKEENKKEEIENESIHDEKHNIRPSLYDLPKCKEFDFKSPFQLPSQFPYQFRFPLRKYQSDVVSHMLLNDSLLMIHATGTGKTLTCVASIKMVLDLDLVDSVVLSTTKSVVPQFENELKLNNVDMSRVRVLTHSGLASMCEEDVKSLQNKFIVIDEAHKFTTKIHIRKDGKLASGSRSFRVVRSVKYAKKVLLSTATPMVNSVADLVNLWSMLVRNDDVTYPGGFAQLSSSIESRFDTLKDSISYYHPLAQSDFPDVSFKHVVLEMNPTYFRHYKNLANNPDIIFSVSNPEPFYNGARRASNFTTEENSPKVDYTMELIRSKPDQNMIVYSMFLSAGMLVLKSVLETNNISHAFICGTTPTHVRDTELKRYNSGEARILLMTSAGNEGLDTKNTRHLVLFEPIWNITRELQAIGRSARIGSHSSLPPAERSVTIHNLYMRVPISEGDTLSMDFVMNHLKNKKQQKIKKQMEKLKEKSI